VLKKLEERRALGLLDQGAERKHETRKRKARQMSEEMPGKTQEPKAVKAIAREIGEQHSPVRKR
jgi:hypothetical protein